MPDIVISEFMSELAVARLSGRYDTLYDPSLVDRPAELAVAVREARVLIVRTVRGLAHSLMTGRIGLPMTLPWPVGKKCTT